jgi:hypothetical protein
LLALSVFFTISGTLALAAIAVWLVALLLCFRGLERFANSGLARSWPIGFDQPPPQSVSQRTR